MIKYGFALITSFGLSISTLMAQSFISFPFRGYDENAIVQIGFQYNIINQNYQLTLKKDWKQLFENLDTDPQDLTYMGPLKSIQSKSANGFSVGIPIDVKLKDRLAINLVPSFNILNTHQIRYTALAAEHDAIFRKSKHILEDKIGDNFNSFEFPLALKLLSEEKKILRSETKFRAYILGGVRMIRWVGLNDNYNSLQLEKLDGKPTTDAIVLKPEYISWDVGLGLDIYLSYFKVSPEIRFNQSINNVFATNNLLASDNKFMAPIERGLIRNIYLSLIFQ